MNPLALHKLHTIMTVVDNNTALAHIPITSQETLNLVLEDIR